MNSSYNKLTFTQWLRGFKSFDSMAHFKRYIDSIARNKEEKESAKLYYRTQYESWFIENFGGLENAH